MSPRARAEDAPSRRRTRAIAVGAAVLASGSAAWYLLHAPMPPRGAVGDPPAMHEPGAAAIERVDRRAPMERRSASPIAHPAVLPSTPVAFEVEVVSAIDRAPLPGMRASLLAAGRTVPAVEQAPVVVTQSDGVASVSVMPGTYAVVVEHPDRSWIMVEAAQQPCVVAVPSARRVVAMVPRFEARFQFVGDKARNVRVGPIQGFELDNALTLGGSRNRPIAVVDGVHHLSLVPHLSFRGRELWVDVDAVGSRSGEASFRVPARPAGSDAAIHVCDFRTAQAAPLVSVLVDVVDALGRNVDAAMELSAEGAACAIGVTGRSSRVPTGHRYRLSLGPVPVHWTIADPFAAASLDLRDGATADVRVRVDLPVAIVHKEVEIVLDGQPLPRVDGAIFRVVGVWGTASCKGMGYQGLEVGRLRAVRLPLPAGKVTIEVEYEGKKWRKDAQVDEGPSLRIELASAEGVPR